MNYYEEQASYEAALGAQAEYEAAMNAQAQAYYEERESFNQYLDSLIYQERFQLLSIEIVLDMIRNEYSEKSGKTIVEFLNEERLKLVEIPNSQNPSISRGIVPYKPQTHENPSTNAN